MKHRIVTGCMISTLALLGSAAQATTGEDHSPPRASTAVERTRSGEDRQIIDNFAPVPPESEQIPFAIKYQNEDEVASLTLSLWALASGQKPPAELLNKAGLDPAAIADFNKKLGPKDQLSNSDRSLLRKSYTRDSFGKRMQARSRYLNFISKFQESFPSAAGVVPEILTVWGEARNIRGFDEADSYNQQAKMATVIHVIRNRSERQREQEPGSPGYRNKWRVVTRRFQFSAFEPYDPNFAELALGPMSNAPFSSVESLPRNDQAALRNLARIIAGMNRGDIQLSKPLVFNNTYHYLTPSLVNYTKENLANLRSQIERSGRRFMVIQIPGSQNPQFIAAVPRWSKQSALISHPPVKIKEPQKAVFQTQIVSPSDFIYFRGIR